MEVHRIIPRQYLLGTSYEKKITTTTAIYKVNVITRLLKLRENRFSAIRKLRHANKMFLTYNWGVIQREAENMIERIAGECPVLPSVNE